MALAHTSFRIQSLSTTEREIYNSMQNLSYDTKDPVFSFNEFRYSIQLFTFENVYGLDVQNCHETCDEDSYTLTCDALCWAGGQESAAGSVTLYLKKSACKIQISIEAQSKKTIRSVKLLLKDLPLGTIVSLREKDELEVPAQGLILSYPEGWRKLYTPLVILKTGENQYHYLRSLDTQVRAKKFVFLRHSETLDVELIFEDLAMNMGQKVSVPLWEIGTCTDPVEIVSEQMAHVEQAYKLVPWEERSDVPQWTKEIALVAAIHCQHWSGYIFNDYARVLESIRWLAKRIDPRHVLLYLPGWEGRYYWQYGDYRPDPRMGGEAGFRELMQGARDLGMHVMPMFGMNVVNASTENYERWGATATFTSAGGYPSSGSVDWDGSRHYDHGWCRLVNPGAPTWQKRLVEQVINLIDAYEFKGVFLDISAAWWNDPNHPVYEGTKILIDKIREHHPEVLIAGEGWYDGIGALTPLMQSGHTDGVLHWHDQPYPEFFARYNRMFAHLCLGDPGRGSTGVHELGYNSIKRAPVRKGSIPTITVVEDTLKEAPDQVMAIITDAKEYIKKYFSH